MLWRFASVSGWREEKAGRGSIGAGTGEVSRAEAPGRQRTVEALKLLQERTLRTSHQKCFTVGSRRGKEIVRTSEAAGLEAVRKAPRVVEGVGSGLAVLAARLNGDGARGV